ncbi:MAG: DUF4054 domain-containing protein [Spiribacter salinus]|uniref:DUF4054 domain-containing protein n=1 Tax=Spiribacter salinus TaxID=1335746 RepID=A0A540VRV2_9GAMM|nr:MAG: DUF4054 domain-containing protein [Spiribacter salinus]
MPTPSEIIDAIAPELASNASKQTHIDLAEASTSLTAYKEQRDYAVALLAAHTMTLASRSGNAGAVTSLKEGQLSIGFAAGTSSRTLDHTSYGAELLRLRRSCILTARTVLVK